MTVLKHTPIAKCRLLSPDLFRKLIVPWKELKSTSWWTFKQTYCSVPKQHWRKGLPKNVGKGGRRQRRNVL